jgi:hypothetical protein
VDVLYNLSQTGFVAKGCLAILRLNKTTWGDKQLWRPILDAKYTHTTKRRVEKVDEEEVNEEGVDPEMIEQPLVKKLFNEYLHHVEKFGTTPEHHYFINYPDAEIRNIMANTIINDENISLSIARRECIAPIC